MVVQYINGDTIRFECVFTFNGLRFGANEGCVLMNFTVPITTYSVNKSILQSSCRNVHCMNKRVVKCRNFEEVILKLYGKFWNRKSKCKCIISDRHCRAALALCTLLYSSLSGLFWRYNVTSSRRQNMEDCTIYIRCLRYSHRICKCWACLPGQRTGRQRTVWPLRQGIRGAGFSYRRTNYNNCRPATNSDSSCINKRKCWNHVHSNLDKLFELWYR